MRKFLFLILAGALLAGCRSVKVVTVEKVRVDTTYITKQQRDSIWLHDSLYIHEYTKGDTVFLERTKWQTKYIERTRTDTVYQSRTDSIPVPYEVIKEVPAKISMPKKILMTIGLLTLMAVALVASRWVSKRLP